MVGVTGSTPVTPTTSPSRILSALSPIHSRGPQELNGDRFAHFTKMRHRGAFSSFKAGGWPTEASINFVIAKFCYGCGGANSCTAHQFSIKSIQDKSLMRKIGAIQPRANEALVLSSTKLPLKAFALSLKCKNLVPYTHAKMKRMYSKAPFISPALRIPSLSFPE